MVDKLFLTGGTGSFGRALLRHWIKLSALDIDVPSVTVLTRSPEKFLELYPEFADLTWLNLCAGNILVFDSLPVKHNFTHVIHAAADSTLESSLRPIQRYDQIVNGTRNLLEFSVAVGVNRFLYISSGGVYGKQPLDLEKLPESYLGMPDVLNPENAYGVAKRTAEHLCMLYCQKYEIETVIARCFTFVGKDFPLNAHFAIGNFIRDALWRDEIVVSGNGKAMRSYLDQADLAEWLLTLLREGRSGTAFNVGSDQSISIAELAYLVRNVIAPQKSVRILGNLEPGRGGRYVPDISKANRELGLKINISLKDAIKFIAKSAKQ